MKPGMQWPIGITLLLAATIVGNLLVMRVAADDPAFAVEPDYYRKAVLHDSTMARQQRSAALGWTAEARFEPLVPGRDTPLHLVLRDARGAPVAGATVRVVALFNARAADRFTMTLTPQPDGSYAAPVPVAHAGLWELRIEATRGAEQFVDTRRVDVLAP